MDGEGLVPLDIKTGSAFQGRSGSWGLLVFPAADTNTSQPAVAYDNHWARVQAGQMREHGSSCTEALPRCLRLALFEHYQDKVLTR